MKKLLLPLTLLVTSQMAMAEHGRRNNNDGYRNREIPCQAEMVSKRGRSFETVFGYSNYSRREACNKARNKCNRRLRRLQRQERRPMAKCVVNGRGGRRRDMVTKSCSAYRYGARGRFLDSYFESATGRRGFAVKQQACNRAMRQCRRDRIRQQYCERSF